MKNDLKKYRWLVWSILCCAYIVGVFHRMGMGVIRYDIEKAFGISALAFAAMGSMYFYVYMVMQVPVGLIIDSLGVRFTASIGIAIAGLGSVLFGLSPTISVVFISRLLVGMGVSVLFVSILKIQSDWFHEREFATLTGLTNFLGSLGGVLAQTPLAALVAVLTWRYAFVLIGIITLILAILCFLFVRSKPSDIYAPIIVNSDMVKNKNRKGRIIKDLFDVCKNSYTWPLFIAFAGIYGPFISLTGNWGQSYLRSVYGMSAIRASNYILIVIFGYLISSVFIGWFSDKLSMRKLPMIIFGSIYLFAWVVLVLISRGKLPDVGLRVLLFIMGFSATSYMPGLASGKEVNNPDLTGISIAVINSGGFLGAAIVPIIFGRVLDKYANILDNQHLYNRAFICCLISVIFGYTALFFIKETNGRNVYNE
jgi:Sugar phosphate permease